MAELETEGRMTRRQVANFLREFADELDGGEYHRDRKEYVDVGEGDDRGDIDLSEHHDDERGEHRKRGEGHDYDEHRERDDHVDRDDVGDSDVGDPEGRRDEAVDTKRVTMIVGGDSATVTIPDDIEFDVEVESRSPMLSSGVKQEIEFELSWEIDDTDAYPDDTIEVT